MRWIFNVFQCTLWCHTVFKDWLFNAVRMKACRRSPFVFNSAHSLCSKYMKSMRKRAPRRVAFAWIMFHRSIWAIWNHFLCILIWGVRIMMADCTYIIGTPSETFSYYSNCFTLVKQLHVCLYKLIGTVRPLLEWGWDSEYGMDGWSGYLLDCYDYLNVSWVQNETCIEQPHDLTL